MPSHPFRRWGARHLLAAWCLYWVVLVLAAAGPPALRVWRLTHDPARHGSATISFNNGVFSGVVKESGAAAWAGSMHAVTLVLWLVVPPLILYALWLRDRPHLAHLGSTTRSSLPRPAAPSHPPRSSTSRPTTSGHPPTAAD